MTLGAGHQRVATPDEPDARPVLLGVGILDGELHLLVLQPLDDPGDDRRRSSRLRLPRACLTTLNAGSSGTADRTAASPAARPAPACPSCVPAPCCAAERVLRDGVIVGEVFLVSPLVGVDVVPARRVLQSRRREPVLRQSDRRPRLHRGQLLLTDVMRQSAAVDADATAEHQRMNAGPVHQIGVIPVIDAGPDEDRALASGVLGGRRPFTGEANQHVTTNAGVLLAPGRACREPLHRRSRRDTRPTAPVDAVLSHQQVVDRRDDDLSAIRCCDRLHRHAASRGLARSEVVQFDIDHAVAMSSRKLRTRLDLAAVLAILAAADSTCPFSAPQRNPELPIGILGPFDGSSHIRNFHSPCSSPAYFSSRPARSNWPGRATPSSPSTISTR